ncbi:MAG: Si-specific transhydrogenase [Pseudomonadota bacterium]|jgi:NAD(P) transhydrogenase
MNHFDLTILGSGPAGKRAAIQAAKLGKSVLIIDDRDRVGGVSVHTGTIPSKTLRETALNLSGWRERGFYGQSYRVKKDIQGSDLNRRLNQTLTLEVDALEHQLARNGVKIINGHGRFLDAHRLIVTRRVGDQTLEHMVTSHRTLIAVGTRPFHPDNVPFDDDAILDSDSIVGMERVPKSLTVVGAGVIGLEYATIFNALDVPVTLIEPRPTILDFMDHEIVENLVCQLRDRAMVVRLGCSVVRVERDGGGPVITYLSDGRIVRSEMLLYTAGRVGATANLDLELCGVETDHRGRITIDPKTFQTSHPDIYAAGDVIGFPSLASTSMEQGRLAACHAFGVSLPAQPAHFPFGIYAVPEISSVGLTEHEAVAAGLQFECGIARLRETSRGHIMGLANGFMKLIFALNDQRLLGVHIIGEGATELIHIGQAVLNLGGTLDYFIENSFNYPTLAEAYKIAALDAWNRMALHTVNVPMAEKPAQRLRRVTSAS